MTTDFRNLRRHPSTGQLTESIREVEAPKPSLNFERLLRMFMETNYDLIIWDEELFDKGACQEEVDYLKALARTLIQRRHMDQEVSHVASKMDTKQGGWDIFSALPYDDLAEDEGQADEDIAEANAKAEDTAISNALTQALIQSRRKS